MHNGFGYGFNVPAIMGFGIAMLVYYLLIFGFGMAVYVLRSLGLYTIARRRGIRHAWFGWVPVLRSYLEGCISDQYQYIVNGKNKAKRKVMLTLSIIQSVLGLGLITFYVLLIINVVSGAVAGHGDRAILSALLTSVAGMAVLLLLMLGVAIAYMVFHYMAMYDLYSSCCPENNALFLVLSIVFNVTEPFFIFFNRKKDDGMRPQKPIPAFYTPVQPENPGINCQEETNKEENV